MVLVFDLDDTLYPELAFVHGGFRAVAAEIETLYGLPVEEGFAFMVAELERSGRGGVFDAILGTLGVRGSAAVRRCVNTYRYHRATLALHPDADSCLARWSRYPQYLVTDGNKLVQARKVDALRLGARMRHCYITHRYGVHHAKPSPYCFYHICKRERVSPGEVIYVGDNPNKDFVGLKPCGFRTIRLIRGPFATQRVGTTYDAEFRIDTLDDLDALVERMGRLPGQSEKKP